MGAHGRGSNDAYGGRSSPHFRRRIDRLLARPAFAKAPAGKQREGRGTPEESVGGLSARNRLHGFVEEVRVDGLLAQVRLRVGDESLTAVITADAVRALKLRRGDDAIAIIKSTEVMIATPVRSGPARRSPKRR